MILLLFEGNDLMYVTADSLIKSQSNHGWKHYLSKYYSPIINGFNDKRLSFQKFVSNLPLVQLLKLYFTGSEISGMESGFSFTNDTSGPASSQDV